MHEDWRCRRTEPARESAFPHLGQMEECGLWRELCRVAWGEKMASTGSLGARGTGSGCTWGTVGPELKAEKCIFSAVQKV